jgi:hypothetical protein
MHIAQLTATGNLVKTEDTLYEQAYMHLVNRAVLKVYFHALHATAYISYSHPDVRTFANVLHIMGLEELQLPGSHVLVASASKTDGIVTPLPSASAEKPRESFSAVRAFTCPAFGRDTRSSNVLSQTVTIKTC